MSNTSQNPTAGLTDKAPKPPGLMPKNLQAIIVFGLAFGMVIIMALTGHKRPELAKSSGLSPLPVPLPVNQDKVTDLQKSIEQKQRESAPQVEAALLEQQQKELAAHGLLAPPNPYGVPVVAPYPNGEYPRGAYATAPPPTTQANPPDPIKEDQKKRQYLSLFTDNVALTYRKDAAGMQPGPPVLSTGSSISAQPIDGPSAPASSPSALQGQEQTLAQEAAQLEREEKMLQQMASVAAPSARSAAPEPSVPNSAPDPPKAHGQAEATSQKAPHASDPAGGAAAPADGHTYVIFEGTVIEALLTNRLEGSFAGPVNCLVTTPVYSHDREHVLIPSGTKVLGNASKVDTFGQTRLAVAFHRLVMPDGDSVSLDQFRGLDQQGATALKDKVNNHYIKIFGASLAVGFLGGVSELGTGSALTAGGADLVRQGFGFGMATAGEQILNKFLNNMPTITIREGTRVKIYLSNDLLLPDYNSHAGLSSP